MSLHHCRYHTYGKLDSVRGLGYTRQRLGRTNSTLGRVKNFQEEELILSVRDKEREYYPNSASCLHMANKGSLSISEIVAYFDRYRLQFEQRQACSRANKRVNGLMSTGNARRASRSKAPDCSLGLMQANAMREIARWRDCFFIEARKKVQ
ncbi:hypothetical protein HGP17_21570 [Rhizobium sp. P38BS-XIX]|uniref:hypothetical protein n=1 Tax=Rhizobium sp. P38BS-XIX TaxID=2726740 RepID=UPI0014577FCA|nr:hypothetical protein [Rhizobium sp. P38BS-XIX]NLR99419.1 hypothetical protein [Rhizobium sp. P38BS-XIX]